MKRQLLENAGETSEHLRENDMVPDPADRATIEEEHALELRTRDRERKLMKKIDQSLARIDDGELRLLRGDRRADRRAAPARAPDRDIVGRGPAAPRAEAEDVRRVARRAPARTAGSPAAGTLTCFHKSMSPLW